MNFPIEFTKMSGTGNDFIIIDNRNDIIPVEVQSDFAKKVCRRMFSVGADGLILIESSSSVDFKWQFYNADGSVAEMCGNGARCAARYAYKKGIAGAKMSFETVAGIISAEIIGEEENVSLLMTDPFDFRTDLKITLDDKEEALFFVNTGVPHAVLLQDESKDIPIKKWGSEIRYHSLFQPAGTNVNFVQLQKEGSLLVRTYERGVEDETMACGTGAVAAAICVAMKGLVESPVHITTSGGDKLTILFDIKEGPAADNVYLQGRANIIYEGILTPESLK